MNEKDNNSEESEVVPPALPEQIESKPIGEKVPALIESLLKRQGDLATELKGGRRGVVVKFSLVALVCLVIFGGVVGTFSMGTQLWAAPLKISLGLLLAGALCFPSLYIFSCLSGAEVRLSGLAGILAGALCLCGLLLVGFIPVVWVFSQSTDSVAFIGGLLLIIWIIALWFGMGFLKRAAVACGASNPGHLSVWVLVFILVTFQMMTSLRPIVGSSDVLLTSEKKFFVQNWFDTMIKDEEDGWQKNKNR